MLHHTLCFRVPDVPTDYQTQEYKSIYDGIVDPRSAHTFVFEPWLFISGNHIGISILKMVRQAGGHDPSYSLINR